MGYATLGAVVEAVTGERWSRHVEKTLFEPLGMQASAASVFLASWVGSSRGRRGQAVGREASRRPTGTTKLIVGASTGSDEPIAVMLAALPDVGT